MSNINIYKKQGGNVMVFGSGSIPVGIALSQTTFSTKAEVIAGTTLLPALDGYQYRMTGLKMISTGAGAATATSVDINADQTGAVILVANAVAGLTDSAVLREGTTNSAVLADGASYQTCTVNTPITMKQVTAGGDLTGSVYIVTVLDYVIEEAR